jgi:hypothetical protein
VVRTIDVVHSPWCFIEVPGEEYIMTLAERYDVAVREFNLWDIDDEDLPGLPEHIAAAIRRARDQSIPEYDWHAGGSLFFLDGERLTLSPALKWPQVERLLQEGEDCDHG